MAYEFQEIEKRLLHEIERRRHIAMDTKEAYMCTKLCGKSSYFLPFNKGTEDGGKGNPHNDNGLNVSYMWEDILTKDTLLYLIKNFIYVEKEEEEDPKTGKLKIKEKRKKGKL